MAIDFDLIAVDPQGELVQFVERAGADEFNDSRVYVDEVMFLQDLYRSKWFPESHREPSAHLPGGASDIARRSIAAMPELVPLHLDLNRMDFIDEVAAGVGVERELATAIFRSDRWVASNFGLTTAPRALQFAEILHRWDWEPDLQPAQGTDASARLVYARQLAVALPEFYAEVGERGLAVGVLMS